MTPAGAGPGGGRGASGGEGEHGVSGPGPAGAGEGSVKPGRERGHPTGAGAAPLRGVGGPWRAGPCLRHRPHRPGTARRVLGAAGLSPRRLRGAPRVV